MVNYYYNNIELPPLPEWDKETYPYVVITGGKNALFQTIYKLYLTDTPLVDVSGCLCANDIHYTIYLCYERDIADGVWTLSKENQYGTFNSTNGPANSQKIWSNYDIMSDEGGLVLPASYPINAETGEDVHDYEIGGDEPEQPEQPTLTASDLYKKVNGNLVKHTLYKKAGGKLVALDEHLQS